jgi:ADP-L-glycero-D-manno-heptose 6-epimerase
MTRKIAFVTGGAGFIGSNIVARLAEDHDLDVVVCDRLREAELGKWRNIAKHPIGDFVAPEAMFEWLERRWRDVEVVVHMAAVSSTTEPDADKIVHSNFTLSRDLFRWCADRQRRLIYASSAATYGDGGEGFVDDDGFEALSRLRPLNTYGWSKALFDIFAARQAARDYAPPQWVGLKFFNVYGPNEYHKGGQRSVALSLFEQVRDSGRARLFRSHHPDYADGGQLRDFVWVEDGVDAVLTLWRQPGVSGLFNIGTGQARSFLDLAHAVFAAMNQPVAIDWIDTPEAIRERYQYFTEARVERLRAAGFSTPFTTLEDGVRSYISDYLSAADPYR